MSQIASRAGWKAGTVLAYPRSSIAQCPVLSLQRRLAAELLWGNGEMKLCRAYGLSLVLLTAAALVQYTAAQVSPDVKAAADQLAGSIYAGPSMITLRELSDGFGGRLSGSPAH